MTELYSKGRQVNKETAQEIIKMLEDHNNYIPSSIVTRREYAHLLLKEYEEYVEVQMKKDRK